MNRFFSTPERLAALELAASTWQGTPFRANSCRCHDGANCVGAIAGVVRDAGFDVPDFPQGPASWSRYQKRSLMENWLDARPAYFDILPTLDDLQPGDIVGFKCGLCVHHLGVILSGGRFFQCNESLGAVILSQAEPMFKKRLARAWRPLS